MCPKQPSPPKGDPAEASFKVTQADGSVTEKRDIPVPGGDPDKTFKRPTGMSLTRPNSDPIRM